MDKTRREFLQYGGITVAGLASFLIPGAFVKKFEAFDNKIDQPKEVDVFDERLYRLEVGIVKKDGHKPVLSGKAVPHLEGLKPKYFAVGFDEKKYKKDKKYTDKLIHVIKNNLNVAYKYA
jgi:hypothetical protein